MPVTWCVLGGGGGFGVRTALHLLTRDDVDQVVGVGRAPLRAPVFSFGLEDEPRFAYCAYHVGHETDLLLEYLDRVKPEVIVNFAAQGESAASWRHSWRYFDTNGTALVRLCEELARREWLRRFVHIGSSEVYGSADIALDESAPIKPTSPYAASKAAFDLYLLSVAQRGFPATVLRPSNAYGPGQQLHRLVPRAMLAGWSGEKLPLHGGGHVEKSYIHSDDLARAIYLAGALAPDRAIYNVGPPEPVTIRSIVERCAETLGIEFDRLVEETPGRATEDSRYWLDSSAFARATNWHPEIDWEEGLEDVSRWVHDNLGALQALPIEFRLRA